MAMWVRIIKVLSRASSLFLFLLLCSCGNIVYHDYRSVEKEWSSTDTLVYKVCNPLARGVVYDVYVELRTTPQYPYRKLWLATHSRRSTDNITAIDTVCCEIFDSLGLQTGTTAGLLYQTKHKLSQIELSATDSVTIEVIHLMGESVSGVLDVGIKVEHCGRHLSSEN